MNRSLRWIAVAALALFCAPSRPFAQPGAFGGGYGPPLVVVPPPKTFATSEEHYKFLLAAAKGEIPAAIDELNAALASDPDLHDARFNLAVAYARAGRRTEATAAVEALLSRLPANDPRRADANRLLSSLRQSK